MKLAYYNTKFYLCSQFSLQLNTLCLQLELFLLERSQLSSQLSQPLLVTLLINCMNLTLYNVK